MPLVADVCRSHTVTHTTFSRNTLNEWSVRRRVRYLHNKQGTEVHALCRIRTRNLSSQAVSDLWLIPHGNRDRLTKCLSRQKNVSVGSLETAESYILWPVKFCVHLKALTDNLKEVGSPEIVPCLSISWFVYSSNRNWRIWRYIDHHCCVIFRMPRVVFPNQGWGFCEKRCNKYVQILKHREKIQISIEMSREMCSAIGILK
jgi:hypothetical protein